MPTPCSWGEQRLVRERSLAHRRHAACALALVLRTVADAHGLRCAAALSLCRRWSLDPLGLRRARQALIPLDRVAYDTPLSQVGALAQPPLGSAPAPPRLSAADTPRALTDIGTPRAETRSCGILQASARAHTAMRLRD